MILDMLTGMDPEVGEGYAKAEAAQEARNSLAAFLERENRLDAIEKLWCIAVERAA